MRTSQEPPGSASHRLAAEGPILDFAQFYQSEFAGLAVLATVISGDPSWGEDLAQEALSRAQGRWDEISTIDKPGAWARRVTINLALSRRRRLQSEARALFRLGSERAAVPRMGEPAVWEAIATLPPRQRALVALHYLEDRPVAEVADLLDLTVSAVTSSLYKARKQLAKVLGEPLPPSNHEPGDAGSIDTNREDHR